MGNGGSVRIMMQGKNVGKYKIGVLGDKKGILGVLGDKK